MLYLIWALKELIWAIMKITIQITALIIVIYKDHLSIKAITNFMA